MALELLHQSNYNYTRAKFYILFPYYKTYNMFRRHQPLILSQQQMEHKINAHIESLKSSKQNDLMKWVKTIQNQMQSRIHISKINTYMEIARHNKYDIPDNIKDIIERSSKIGKQIKKNILNSKNTLEKLQTIKTELQDHKIVTNEMIHFEEAVARAEEWIKKQNKFQQQYFNFQEKMNGQIVFQLKQPQFFRQFGKIQYRTIQSLVNQYNSLPLNYPSFIETTLVIYDETNKLIAKIPSLSKAAKTRKSEQGTGVVKLPRKFITQILTKINEVPVEHQDFINFEISILDGLQQIERISMFLQDTKFEKNIKNLNQFQKLLSDVPIQNDVQKKLNQKIEYYELIDKIRKDISNPAKYDSLKDQLLKLKQKGYQNEQHAKLQARVMTCMGWHQSQQMIKQQKKINNRTFIILNERVVKSKMIKYENFQAQLFSARNQLNIPQDILRQSQSKLQTVSQLKRQILANLDQQEPILSQLLLLFKTCYENGISFLEFEQLYQKLTTILVIVAKMHYLLNTSDEISSSKSNQFYFTNTQCQKVIDFICDKKNQIKDLRTKQTGDQIISTVNAMNFPRGLYEWRVFQQFMRRAQQWSDRAMKIIQDFKNNDNMSNTRQVIEQSRHCLHSKLIQEQLNRIELALKWRQKISRKMMDQNALLFQEQQHDFMAKLQVDLQAQQTNFCSQQQMMFKSLEYMHENGQIINSILQKIADYPIQKVIILKLSQMNKFVKQIDKQIERYQIKDRIIDQLKEQLHIELVLNEDWKQRYLAIKRFQKKKIGQTPTLRQTSSRRRDDDELPDNEISFDLMKDQKQQENHDYFSGYIPKAMQVPYSPSLLLRPTEISQSQKKKYVIKNGQFCWYYRMLLMLFQFYNGCKLKFAVQEFIKLKNTLTDIYRLIQKYNAVYQKGQKTDLDFQYLETEACKIPIFFKESYLVTNKYSQIIAWKNIADHVLRSVPVINMQLKARRVQDWRQILQKKKNQQILNENKATQDQNNQTSNKRRRKPNQLYDNEDITLFRDDIIISKNKKRKNVAMRPIHHPQIQNGHSSSTYDTQYRSSSHHHNKKNKNEKQHHHNYKDQRESLEKIQQLLNGENLQFIIDDPNQYCICRNGVPNQNSLMVGCQCCNGWYHIQCIGIKKHQAKSDDNYLCVGCKSLSDEYQGNYGYFWDHYQKITQYALIEIYDEGRNLEVQTTELNKITLVYNAMMKWKQETNNLLQKLIDQNPINLAIYQQQIYPLYLQSMWLPTVHYEAIHLKKLMKHIRSL